MASAPYSRRWSTRSWPLSGSGVRQRGRQQRKPHAVLARPRRGLPSSFANIDKKRGTPYFAIRVISILGIITAVGLGFIIGDPLNVFAVYATAITILFVVGYMLVAVSCIRYSVREPEKSGNFLLRYVVPACAFLVFVRCCWPRSAYRSWGWPSRRSPASAGPGSGWRSPGWHSAVSTQRGSPRSSQKPCGG